MLSKVLSTPVDDLVELVKTNENCSISFLKKRMNISSEIIERWLIVLEEFEVLNVHYRGFEGFVTISKKTKEKKKKSKINVEQIKEIFIEKSKKREIGYEKMREVWPIFVKKYERDIKDLFEDKARENGYPTIKIEKAWAKYKLGLNKL